MNRTVKTGLENYAGSAGFQYPDRVIHAFIGGSELHGAKLEGTDDMDIYGIYIEPPRLVIGLDKMEHFVYSTSKDSERNGPDDIDITLYSLKRWAELACKGNPTALHFLFANNRVTGMKDCEGELWFNFKFFARPLVVAKSCTRQFIGFVDAQLGRLLGTRGKGKKGQRPELEQEFGYDTKAAMHAMRLMGEGIELMKTGRITFPRPDKDWLIAIRKGAWSLDHISSAVNGMIADLKVERDKSSLPDEPDRQRLSKLVTESYLNYWRQHGETS